MRKHNVDLLIPGIEQDAFCYASDAGFIAGMSARFVLNQPELIHLCRDKWLMHEALRALGHSVRIPSRLNGGFEELADIFGLPFLLKPRVGYASKGLIRVSSQEHFDFNMHRLGEELMAQPIVGSDDEEYTVGVFGDGNGGVNASIILQRKLSKEGATSKACVRHLPDLDEVVKELSVSFCPLGPTNFQFRRDAGKWWLLEINPRISSSTSLRAAFGFNEADMCVRYYLEADQIKQPFLRTGYAMRYIADFVKFENDCTDL
jgi:carbamoyl-phosphate synthase large subunit